MSYTGSAALQAAVYTALSGNAALDALVQGAIYDTLPSGALPTTYVSFGTEEARGRSDVTAQGSEHIFTVSVVTEEPGFLTAKQVAAAVCDALHDQDLSLDRGRLVSLSFLQARATRIDGAMGRQINLIFRARLDEL